MAVLPTLKVELAFGSGFSTTAVSRTWTDVSAYVPLNPGASITYGRSDEQSQPTPNTCSVTLENIDGRFTPGYTSGAYYPNVVKGVPLRVSVVYSGTTYVRFVGYVNEWPVQWPTGGDNYSTVSITASSRRARLGQTAPLPSAIRAAYLATSPEAYWPMDEDTDITDRNGRQAFRDITNSYVSGGNELEPIGAFSVSDALAPVVRDGTAGPTDEQSLVRFPAFTSSALLYTWPHFVGAGNVFQLPVSGGLTAEVVARLSGDPTAAGGINARVLWMSDVTTAQQIEVRVLGDVTVGVFFSLQLSLYDSFTYAVIDIESAIDTGAVTTDPLDGALHHYLVTLTSSTTATLYIDGVAFGTATFTSGSFTAPFTQIALGDNTLNTTAWLGHAAVHTRALTTTEIATHASAAIAADETIATRVTRLATYLNVPAAEVSAETSIAASLGPQPEKGQTASSVLDAVAQSTGGVLYDARDGTLTLQARNHRYNSTSAFTLSTSGQEIEADLTATLDDRYLINSVDVTRTTAGSDTVPVSRTDDTSIDTYGLYSQSVQMVSSSDDEAEALANDIVYRYSVPKVRVSQVSVTISDLSSSQRALVLAGDIGTRFTTSGLPAQAPAASLDHFIEGYTEQINIAGHMATVNTTPAGNYPTMQVVGTAVVGSSTLVVY